MTMTKPKLLVSACLLGENCKYSGGNNRDEQVRALERYFQLISQTRCEPLRHRSACTRGESLCR